MYEAGDYVDGCSQRQSVVRAFEDVPTVSFEQALVDGGKIGEQEFFLVVEELLLDGAVEAFTVRVYLRGTREGVPMSDVLGLQGLMRAVPKVRPVTTSVLMVKSARS